MKDLESALERQGMFVKCLSLYILLLNFCCERRQLGSVEISIFISFLVIL